MPRIIFGNTTKFEVLTKIYFCSEYINKYAIYWNLNKEQLCEIAEYMGKISLQYSEYGYYPEIDDVFQTPQFIHERNILSYISSQLNSKLIHKLKEDINIYTLPKPYQMFDLTIKRSNIYQMGYAFIMANYTNIKSFKSYIKYSKNLSI